LAGGSGTRLWPLSRKSYPKQFSKLFDGLSLFQQSAHRLTSSKIVDFNPIIILTSSEFRFIAGEQLQRAGIKPGQIIIEPSSKNTAPAILLASLFTELDEKNSIVLVAPSDHVIANQEAFHEAISYGIEDVKNGKIVTFGIKPSRAETGYGYLELSKIGATNSYPVERFVEKPDAGSARKMLDSGNFCWNAGIFMFRSSDMLRAFEQHAPEMIAPVQSALSSSEKDLDFIRLDPKAWEESKEISIDYAIMEKATNLVAIPFDKKWSDLGDWGAVWHEMEKDENRVAKSENAHAIECQDTLLRSESPTLQLVGLGLKNIVAIAMPDAVLVADKSRAQEVKFAVDQLRKFNLIQAEKFPKEHRPWGWFETLTINNRFHVKRIVVNPDEALSLQSHHHRSEHWIVVEGTAKVTVDDNVKLVTEGQSAYVPLGATHRLENPGKLRLVLIEVQTGAYLGEDDIVRYEDKYARHEKIKP